ncbi:hypothetical protein PPL_12333 [Heterostelium album PN500]|uniref:Uncharacterized protein n=1 Tax=Heterostelium pallidum (strain ATCC 26659 / Pp 5 / PN500) TaxID=670386 RepID=D3BMC0_HETP5|nr:hypothetical protein PPL_12333 [Heterostelium album PN500]EFA77721.1 hypothetical protein PPL_12333 [Heterostelium album PN500]|eukprot:XP_020429849.1 hypothetical protein PPL_12333 [Heterostelium album PN500]
MGLHKPNLIVLLILVLMFVLLIVSFSSSWYKTSIRGPDHLVSYIQYKYDSIQNITKSNATIRIEWNSDQQMPNAKRIFQLSFAFTIVAWVFTVVNITLIGFSLGGYLKKIPPCVPINNIVRFLPIGMLIFTLLSVFTFLGLPRAIDQDCWEHDNFGLLCQPEEQRDRLVGSLNEGNISWGPIEGWFCCLISSALSLAATAVSIISSRYTI